MFEIDWEKLFVPSGSLLEIAFRGTAVYLMLFLAMRFLPRRTLGGLGAADLLVVVVIADAVQNAMSGSYESITEGLLLAAVIFGWATLIDWVDYKWPRLHLAQGAPLLLIRGGRILHRNLHREQITEEELMGELRQHGIEELSKVDRAYMEGDGKFSILLKSGRPGDPPPARKLAG
jgi:uncharacterized membrane protein YcaP (DUF421 family)